MAEFDTNSCGMHVVYVVRDVDQYDSEVFFQKLDRARLYVKRAQEEDPHATFSITERGVLVYDKENRNDSQG